MTAISVFQPCLLEKKNIEACKGDSGAIFLLILRLIFFYVSQSLRGLFFWGGNIAESWRLSPSQKPSFKKRDSFFSRTAWRVTSSDSLQVKTGMAKRKFHKTLTPMQGRRKAEKRGYKYQRRRWKKANITSILCLYFKRMGGFSCHVHLKFR